jgi:4-alpha-glucanotransferase
MSKKLARLAEKLGIASDYISMTKQRVEIDDDGRRRMLAALEVDASSKEAVEAALERFKDTKPPVMKPAKNSACYLPKWLEDKPAWGIPVQLYELRSGRNWGIGDFKDLADFCRIAGAHGADFVGVNPLHALFLSEPERNSPFSPSTRLFLNPIYIAVDRLPGGELLEDERDEFNRLRETALVDYPGVTSLKLRALRRAWEKAGRNDPALEAFREKGGEALERHALFDALALHLAQSGTKGGWKTWPAEYQNPESEAVKRFAEERRDEVMFHVWLQYLARTQLEEADEAAKGAGLRVGIYLDFAVGEAPDGSATWSKPNLLVSGMTIGAPPDMFTLQGQDWGLVPMSPLAMREENFATFKAIMEGLMASAGALRIDHAMALWQLFFVPQGLTPADGAYQRYPIRELLALLTKSSRENETVVIGEDLGIVPPGFQDVMAQSNILSYRILYFEQTEKGFKRPKDYPAKALACLATHDLPTWRGWWKADDTDQRLNAGLIDEGINKRQHKERAKERKRLVKALVAEKLLSKTEEETAKAAIEDWRAPLPDALAVAVHRYMARTPSLLAGARLADLVGEAGPTNVPGTTNQFPNWSPKLDIAIEDMPALPLFKAITAALAAERPRR